jgi:hypothetical protein
MFARRLFAWWVYLALTTPVGLLAHFAFEAFGRRDGGFSPLEADHVALMSAIVCLIVAVTFGLRRGSRDERRLRIAHLRAGMPRGPGLVVATCVVQMGVAAGTLALEELAIDPTRVACALVLGIATAFLGASAFCHVEDTILTVAAALNRLPPHAPATSRVVLALAAMRPICRVAIRRRRGRSPPPFRSVTISY